MNASLAPVLLGLDTRADMAPALAAALALAAPRRRAVHAVHVVELPENVWRGMALDWVAKARADVFAEGERRAERALATALGALGIPRPPQLTIAVAVGHPARALAEAAEAAGSDLIVVGPHVKQHAFDLGSVPRALLAHGPRHVWVQRGPFRPPRAILCPVDLSELSLAALAVARDLALETGARLEVLHSFVPPDLVPQPERVEPVTFPTYVVEDMRKRDAGEFDALSSRFDWRGVPHHMVFAEGEAEAEILSRQEHVDLIVLGTHGHTGLARFLLGNVAAAVLGKATRAVLAVRPS